MNKLSKKTAEEFVEKIKPITEEKILFLSIQFIFCDEDNEPIDSDDEIFEPEEMFNTIEFVKKKYNEFVGELEIKNNLGFDKLLKWFKDEKIIDIQDKYIKFYDPSYSDALDTLLLEDEFKKTFSKILLTLFEKDEATASIAMIITSNFDKLPDDIKNLLFKLYEKAAGNSAITISSSQESSENTCELSLELNVSDAAIIACAIANNYNKLPENVRVLLFKLFENDLMAAEIILSIAAEHKDKMYDDIMNFLLKISEKNDFSMHVQNIVRDNFDEISEDIRIKLLLNISKNQGGAEEIATIVRENLDKFPDDIKTKLLFKLSEKEDSAVKIACIIEDNFDKIPEMIRTKLLFKLSELNNTDLVVANIVEKKFDKLPEDARNILLFNLSEKEKFHYSVSNIISKNFEKFSEEVVQKLLEKIHRTLQQIVEAIYINHYYLSKEKELQLISMFTNKVKVVNLDGDYYYCGLCDKWHIYRCDIAALGNKHVAHIDEKKMNIQVAKYYFCGICNKWHTDVKTDHLKYRVQIERAL